MADNNYSLDELTLEITNACLMKCDFCSSDSSLDNNINSLTVGQYINIIDEAIKLGLKKLAISGGEPFMNLDIYDIISFAKRSGIHVDIYTCGCYLDIYGKYSCITSWDAERLFELGVDNIIFSIHGDTDTRHDSITGVKGSFNNLMKSV